MKKLWLAIVLIILCFALPALADTAIDETNFPDAVFREFVKEFDTDGNGILSDAEIAEVTVIDCKEKGILDLTGIRVFKNNLKELYVSRNELSELDITSFKKLEILYCSGNKLTGLDFTGCSSLWKVLMGENPLDPDQKIVCPTLTLLRITTADYRTLDVTGCPALQELSFHSCTKLQSVNVSGCDELEELICMGCSTLKKLNLSGMPKLKRVDAFFCGAMKTLNITGSPFLVALTKKAPGFPVISEHQGMEYSDGDQYIKLEMTVQLVGAAERTDAPADEVMEEAVPAGDQKQYNSSFVYMGDKLSGRFLAVSRNPGVVKPVSVKQTGYIVTYRMGVVAVPTYSFALELEGVSPGTAIVDLYDENGTIRLLSVQVTVDGDAPEPEPEDIFQASVAAVADQVYTGKAVKPELTVMYNDNMLSSGTDYTTAYTDNINAGTATVTLTGTGSYEGTKTVTFKIVPAEISKTVISAIKNQTYTGKAVKPKLTVKFNKKKLAAGTDYTLSYKNNKAVGNATVTVKGLGNFTGSVKATFTIIPKPVKLTALEAAGSGRLTVRWKTGSGVSGYQIEYSLKKNFSKSAKVKVAGAGKKEKRISGLAKGKTYYVRIRSYKTVKGKQIYSDWSAAMKQKTKK